MSFGPHLAEAVILSSSFFMAHYLKIVKIVLSCPKNILNTNITTGSFWWFQNMPILYFKLTIKGKAKLFVSEGKLTDPTNKPTIWKTLAWNFALMECLNAFQRAPHESLAIITFKGYLFQLWLHREFLEVLFVNISSF